ncbi:MAG: type III-A CRISPR-associated RAMP protein Csm4 [Bacteroidales bacterium]|nr:type III-A CRISPR-associated RAMP protein Csm4 [Bacteroidales bacterium]
MHLIKLDLRPGTQFHLGNRVPFDRSVLHDTDRQIHSDTLFSALVNIAAKIGKANEMVEELQNQNTLSSAFYLLENGDDKFVYFLPRPTVPLIDSGDTYKFIKQKAFVSIGVFEMGIAMNQWKDKTDSNELIAGKNWIVTNKEIEELLGSEFDLEKIKNIKLFEIANIPQVRVHTTEEEHNYYQVGNLQIADNSELFEDLQVHFYFLLKEPPSDVLQTVLNLLPHEGIGGQRSTGCGQILSASISETERFNSLHGDSFLALSKVIPTNEEVSQLGEKSYYQTTVRGGRIIDNAQNLRLKQVRMINEGAVFENSIVGSVPDLRPDGKPDPYMRYGKAFLIQIPNSISHA